MTQQEIFDIEQDNLDKIYLYSEGLFWKAYEKSAFNFVTNVKEFKPTKRIVKTVGEPIVSIGFPKAGLEKYCVADKVTHISQTQVEVTGFTVTVSEFESWKESIELTTPTEKPKTRDAPPNEIVQRVREFNFENKTPVECMLFLSQIKELANQTT